jgi:hypothetical protein
VTASWAIPPGSGQTGIRIALMEAATTESGRNANAQRREFPMKRTILNALALTLILGGASHLNAQTEPAPPLCCSGGGYSCCGPTGCEIGPSGCSAW